MQDFYLVLNWLVALSLLGLGVLALTRSRTLLINRVFLFFTVAVGVWIISSYISNDVHNSPRVSVVGNYFVFLFSFISAYLLLWFAIALAENKAAEHWLRRTTVLFVVVGAISGSPLVVAGAKRQGSVYALQFGPLVLVYFVGLITVLIATMVVLHRAIRRTKGDQKSRLELLYWSMMVALPVLLLTEFILPALTGWWALTDVGILMMAIPALGLYYGAIKHRLFDLRMFVVRAVAYIISLTLITLVYLLPLTFVVSKLLSVQFTGSTFLVLVVAGLGFSVIYHFGRSWFDKLTIRVFYRNYYNPQDVLDKISNLLVRTVDLDELKAGASEVIKQTIGTKSCDFWLHGKVAHTERLESLFRGATQNVLILDELADHTDVKQRLARQDVAVLVRLRTTHGELGYIALGFKESGGGYNQRDKQLLSTVADELAIGMQNALRFEEIQKFNVTLQERVEKATGQLRRSNHRLRELDSNKDDFISMASHQLRTPLTSVKGYLSMVLEGDAGDLNDNQRKLLEQSYRSSQQMVFLISDLLNLSRLNTGKFVIEPSSVDLSELVQFEVGQLDETARSRNIRLHYERPTNFPSLMLDETKIHQVVMNFIDNAIYYTPSGGVVTIALRETPTYVEYTVKDTGIGVPKEAQRKLFSKFFRADNAQKARPDGTGLGLFMAKKVVAAQGGALIFESEEGKGSTFGFRFNKSKHVVPTRSATGTRTE